MNNQDENKSDEVAEKAASHTQQLADKILLGLSSKRSDEEWEHFKEQTIQMFRDKGLFQSTKP